MILILMVLGARAVISFCILSAIPGYMVVPPDITVLAYRSLRMSTSHFMMELKVVPPCTLVLLTGCRRRSLPLLPAPSRSRSLLLPRGSTPYGSVAPSSPPCPPSSRCGSPSRSTMSAAHPLSTASASNYFISTLVLSYRHVHVFILRYKPICDYMNGLVTLINKYVYQC